MTTWTGLLKMILGAAAISAMLGGGVARAGTDTARTCVATIQTNIGAVTVLRKIGPKQS